MARRRYVNNSAVVQLSASITSSATTVSVSNAATFPTSYPWTAVIDGADTSLAEVVLVTAATGANLTVTRGYDGTPAQAHAVGATFAHEAVRADFDEANAHVNTNAGVHGVVGSVVGTTDTQTLSGKTLQSPTVTGTLTGSPAATLGATTTTTLSTSGVTTLGGNTTVNGTLQASGNTTLSGALAVAGAFGWKPTVTADWNAATATGFYYGASTAANGPSANAYVGLVLDNSVASGTAAVQILWRLGSASTAIEQWQRNWTGTAWQPWGQIFGDTGWQSTGLSGIAAASGFGSLTYSYRILNNVFYLNASVTRTSATDLTFTSGGGLPDTAFLNFSGAMAPTQPINSSFVATFSEGGYRYDTTAQQFLITDGHPTSAIQQGQAVKISLSYPLG